LVDTANRSESNGWWDSQDIGDSKCGMDFTLQEGPGTYELWFNYGDSQTFSVLSNVEWESLDYADFKLPSLSFHYELPGSRKAEYAFTITEPTAISFTASAGETCTLDETGEEGNGFADPELDLYYVDDNGYWEDVADDDDGGHGPGNCSASWIQVELEPGNYVLDAEDDDNEGGVVTVNSSVELTLVPSNDPQTFSDITAPKSYTITVPAGGKDFVAIANSGNSEDVCDDYYWDQELPYVDPYLVLVNTQTGAFFRDDNDGEDEADDDDDEADNDDGEEEDEDDDDDNDDNSDEDEYNDSKDEAAVADDDADGEENEDDADADDGGGGYHQSHLRRCYLHYHLHHPYPHHHHI
jgi:hypothetical protein